MSIFCDLRRLVPTRILLLFIVACSASMPANADSNEAPPPNFVVIVVDDLRTDEFSAGGHPFLSTPSIDRLATEGASFSRAYHATPLCSPNRASLLTGQYASRHGIFDNTSRSYASHRLALFPIELQRAGYATAHIGKWHMGNDPTPRPGYDYWVSFKGQGRSINPILWEEGGLREVEGYVTDLFTDRTVDFINRSAGKPFFVYLGHKAIHPDSRQLDDGSVDVEYGYRYVPAAKHHGKYEEEQYHQGPDGQRAARKAARSPVVVEALTMKDEIIETMPIGPLLPKDVSLEFIRRRAEMMLSVDESLGRILDSLEQNGVLDNTLVVFATDNGYFFGEHGLTIERRLPYEEAVRGPLLMRYPKLIRAGSTIDELFSSVDLAPTILDIAGLPIPGSIQGVSQKSVFANPGISARNELLIEFYGHENPFLWTAKLDYRAIISGDYKYIKWLRYEGEDELYDLAADPGELRNLANNPKFAEQKTALAKQLKGAVLHSLGLSGSR